MISGWRRRLLWHRSRCAAKRYISSILVYYLLWTSIDLMKENDFTLAKERSRRYATQTIMDADYADDIALLANTHALAESLLHSLERATGGIGLPINEVKTEYMCSNERSDISTQNGDSLKLVDKFTCFGSSISSIKNDINTRQAKAWTAIDKLSVIWKSELSDKLKHSFFPSSGNVDTAIWMYHVGTN